MVSDKRTVGDTDDSFVASRPLRASAKLTNEAEVKRYQAPGAGRSKAVGVPESIRGEHRQAPVVALALAGVAVVAAGPRSAPLCALAGLIGPPTGAPSPIRWRPACTRPRTTPGCSPVALQAGVLVPAAAGGGTSSAVSGICVPGGTRRSWG